MNWIRLIEDASKWEDGIGQKIVLPGQLMNIGISGAGRIVMFTGMSEGRMVVVDTDSNGDPYGPLMAMGPECQVFTIRRTTPDEKRIAKLRRISDSSGGKVTVNTVGGAFVGELIVTNGELK